MLNLPHPLKGSKYSLLNFFIYTVTCDIFLYLYRPNLFYESNIYEEHVWTLLIIYEIVLIIY